HTYSAQLTSQFVIFLYTVPSPAKLHTLSLHDALPISSRNEITTRAARGYGGFMNEDYLWDKSGEPDPEIQQLEEILKPLRYEPQDRKSTRLNSSHSQISYAVFCLKKKKKQEHVASLQC